MATLLTFPARIYSRLSDIQLARTASSLSFTTLLAIVPLASIGIPFVARFPVFEQALAAFEAFLLKDLLPPSTQSLMHEHVMLFAQQASRLTGVSILLVSFTAALALYTVEREINRIWGIRHGRSLSRRVLIY